MNVSTMRLVDRWVGVPICLALTIFRKLRDFFALFASRAPAESELRSILFVKLAEQGATVLAYPAIARAVEMVGRENVYFLVFEDNRFVLDAMDAVPAENVFTISTDKLLPAAWGAFKTIRRIRRERIKAALDFEFYARASAILSYLSGAGRRVGLHAFAGEGPYRGDLMTHRLTFNPHLHISQTFQVMVEALLAAPADLPAMDISPPPVVQSVPQFRPGDDEVEEVRQILQGEMPDGRLAPLILLNANCSDLLPIRRWPEENYVKLAHRLTEKFPETCIAFTGAPSEVAGVEKLMGRIDCERCFSLAGKTTLRQLLILYSFAKVLVTNDSGPAHFAALTPINAVVLFGPETPELFGMRSERSHILWTHLPCSPCVSVQNNRLSPCTNNICLQKISVDSVFEKICEFYQKD